MEQPKFRGYSVETNKWHFGHGWFISDFTEDYLKEKNIGPQTMLYQETSPIQCELKSMGQCINEVDIYGNDIYEGDLLEIQNGATSEYQHFLAKVHRHGSSFNLCKPIYHNTVIAQPVPHFVQHTGKIIGNAYELSIKEIENIEKRIEKENENRI